MTKPIQIEFLIVVFPPLKSNSTSSFYYNSLSTDYIINYSGKFTNGLNTFQKF